MAANCVYFYFVKILTGRIHFGMVLHRYIIQLIFTMHYTTIMSATFEAEKNRKAFIYTTVIVGVLLLIAFIWTWQLPGEHEKVVDDLIEVNLGNLQEGFGDVQPLIKGEKSPGEDPAEQPQQTPVASNNNAAENTQEEDSKDEDAVPVNKPVKAVTKPNPTPTTQPVKNPNPTPAVVNEPKPQKPKIAGYGGPKGGTGNGATEDNGYTYQGNKPGGKGDAGSPNGNPDSYGNNPGGRVAGGALRVSKGDRSIVNNYIFMGDLPKATINAIIKVNPEGRGTFMSFDKGSTSNDARYASAIRSYLPNIQFNKSDHESIVTVPFNFRVN
jgi:hypothetical protein